MEQMEIANAKYGLDQPLLVQMKNYLLNYLHGDMGESLKMQRGTPVKDIIFGQGKFELSIQLGVLALFLTVLMGIPLGCIAAYNRGSKFCCCNIVADASFGKIRNLASGIRKF